MGKSMARLEAPAGDSGIALFLAEKREIVDQALDEYLPAGASDPREIHECMRYCVAGGKRLRPVITLAIADVFGCPINKMLPTCVAIELIHTHSLVLDDMPFMDNDRYRRGKPTAHRRYGEAVALLAADAVLNLAISILGTNHRLAGISPETSLDIIREVGEAAGTQGMIGAQAADLAFANPVGAISAIEWIHLGKTARLFRLSGWAAALIANASPVEMAAVCRYAEGLGLAFQIVDDILDHNPRKATRQRRAEPSYASACGIAGARGAAAQATWVALQALQPFGPAAELLRALAEHNLARTN